MNFIYFLRDLCLTAREERGDNSGKSDLRKIEYLMVNSSIEVSQTSIEMTNMKHGKVTEGNERSFKFTDGGSL